VVPADVHAVAPHDVGEEHVSLDGHPEPGMTVPLADDRKEHHVNVRLDPEDYRASGRRPSHGFPVGPRRAPGLVGVGTRCAAE